MRRAVALAVLALAAPAHAHDWQGTSGDDAGHGVVSRGEAIWTNELYDDYGANVDGFRSMDPDLLIVLLSPHLYADDPARPAGFAPSGNVGRFRHSGDYGYPPNNEIPADPANDPFGDNSAYDNVANVAEVRVAADATTAYFRFALTDLKQDSTVIGLAVDSDPGSGTGGGAWPFAAGLSSSGWDAFLTVWGSGGAVSTPGGGDQPLPAGAVTADLERNVIEVQVPIAQLAPRGGRTWRLVAGTGRWDAGTKQWAVPQPTTTQTTSPGALATGPRVYELPFHHDEPNSLWHETRQADDLEAGKVDDDAWTVDLDQLAAGATITPPCRAGPHEESFSTGAGFPAGKEGLYSLPTQAGGAANVHNVNYVYRWQRQPLGVMLPPAACDPAAPAPSLDLFFHPANVNQNAWFVGMEGDHDRVNYLDDPPLDYSYVTALARKYNRITAGGLGRTEGWNYGDAPGEERADFDAFRAVTARHRHDRDHVRVIGMSGRLGPEFFAEQWPDRVSSILHISPHTADTPRLANLRNTPFVFAHGTAHLELQSDLPSYAVVDQHLSDMGYQYLQMTWNGRGHDFGLLNRGYALAEPWTRAARVHPARITYYVDPKQQRPGVPLFPGVDWVRSLALADAKHPAQIDVTDLAKAAALPRRETRFSCSFTDAATTDDVDYHGLSYETPEVLKTRMPPAVEAGWTDNGCTFAVKALHPPAARRALTGTLTNVAALRIDLRRAGLDPERPLDVSGLRSETPVRLRLDAGRAHQTVTVPGARCVPATVMRFRLQHANKRRTVSAVVFVDGRARLHKRGHALRSVTLPRPARRAFTVVIVKRLANGIVVRSTRRYDGCHKTRPKVVVTAA